MSQDTFNLALILLHDIVIWILLYLLSMTIWHIKRYVFKNVTDLKIDFF